MTTEDRTAEVLDAIDHAIGDWTVSGDAMRWTPEPAEAAEPDLEGLPEPLVWAWQWLNATPPDWPDISEQLVASDAHGEAAGTATVTLSPWGDAAYPPEVDSFVAAWQRTTLDTFITAGLITAASGVDWTFDPATYSLTWPSPPYTIFEYEPPPEPPLPHEAGWERQYRPPLEHEKRGELEAAVAARLAGQSGPPSVTYTHTFGSGTFDGLMESLR